MNRTTIDFGIDLGTTNSAIAVLRGTITDIIKENLYNNDITASAVHIDKHGFVKTGVLAKNPLEHEESADDVYIEFKRKMGTAHEYKFKSAGRTMKPEELSAEVLKSLRGNVQQRLGEEIQASVITIPAAFQQRQCAATKRAAELAGLVQCPLVQEPVAAALAYGFQAELTRGYWLIYDFGGGTFDAAIMKAEDGTITVVNHGGDNCLGGSDIDWAVMEQIVLPELRRDHNLPDFSRGNKKWRAPLSVIKRSVEEAKIQLSRSETAYLEGRRFKDVDGDEIELDFKLTRDALISVAEPIIMRSIEICRRVLKEKNLSSAAIERVILVGGPTLAPYFREMLETGLGIPLDFSVDPLTVVARGAAVFAGTQRLEGTSVPKAAAGQYDIDLKYKPVGADEDPTIWGTVKAQQESSVEGFTIEFVNQQTHWRSGKIPLKENGHFKLNLLAEKRTQNIFTIELLDPTGRRLVTVPDSIAYTIGMAISEQPFCNSVGVALANNEVEVYFGKGEPYPATKTIHDFHTTQALRKGETGDLLKIPVVEGENPTADRNRLLGHLPIHGTKVRRDVPAGSEVEVTLYAKEPGVILVKAYIPILDEEFEITLNYNDREVNQADLRRRYEAELKRLEALREQSNNAEDRRAFELLDSVEDGNTIETLENLLDAAEGDGIAAEQAETRLLEIIVKMDEAEDNLKWPALVAEASKALDELDTLIKEHGNEDQQERADKLREQAEELIRQKRDEPLRRSMKHVLDLHREVLFEQPGFWVGFFKHLIEQRDKMNDQITADRLFNQGQIFIECGNVQGLRSVVGQLLGLIPQEEAEAIKRGYQSGLLK